MRGRLIAAGALFFVAGMFAVLLFPDRLQLVITFQSAGANQIALPVVYWAIAAGWASLAARTVGDGRTVVACRAILVAFIVHVLLALVLLAAKLTVQTDFSSGFYWMYARAFYAAVLASTTVWAARWFGRQRTTGEPADLIELPVVLAAAALAVATLRHDFMIAVVGLGAGCVLAWCGGAASSVFGRLMANERLFLLFVFVLAAGLRVLYTRHVMGFPGYLETGADGPLYDQLGWSVAEGRGIPASFREQYPLLLLGYVWFIAGIYTIAGHSYFAACAAQAVLGAAACLIVYSIAKSLFGASVARVTALFTALSFPLIFSAAGLGHQAVDVFLTASLVWLLIRGPLQERSSASWWALAGVTFGCAIAVRETNVFFLAFAFAWIIWETGRQRRSRVPALVATTVGMVVVLVPIMVPTVASAEDRLRLRQHLDRLFTGQGDEVKTRTGLAAPFADPGAAVQQLRTEPGFVAKTLARAVTHNFAVQFLTQPYGGFDLVFLVKSSSYYYVMWAYAYVFALVGLVVAVRRAAANGVSTAGIALVLGLLVSRTLPHLVLESAYRHRAPIEPFLIMLTALGVVSLFQKATDTRGLAPAS